MVPTFTLHYTDSPRVSTFPTLYEAVRLLPHIADSFPATMYVELPGHPPRQVRAFTGAGIPLVECGGALVPLY